MTVKIFHTDGPGMSPITLDLEDCRLQFKSCLNRIDLTILQATGSRQFFGVCNIIIGTDPFKREVEE